ncbi:hypothetical protein B0A50_08362 [Salinomyces thailandicus]|uniref:Zn(2)-C6 fungal-type domain-containing protein n=1 Tax=Salinomyces thailandicus TaxID=706561 RepID=A0A4U0TJT1_9PEZI|nr:hypothetical protein B0A50_08362 [Salinomyces thailandica]
MHRQKFGLSQQHYEHVAFHYQGELFPKAFYHGSSEGHEQLEQSPSVSPEEEDYSEGASGESRRAAAEVGAVIGPAARARTYTRRIAASSSSIISLFRALLCLGLGQDCRSGELTNQQTETPRARGVDPVPDSDLFIDGTTRGAVPPDDQSQAALSCRRCVHVGTAPTPTSQPPPPPQGQWSPQPPNGQYTPRQNQIPPISQALPQQPPAMQTLQPQHPDQYRALPAPPQMYAPPYQPQMQYAQPQPAPRQRTAIACRYCRRRKIRCSGFDQSEDGRCTNCQRFSQECVFTPVSAQTQAFVPAHTVWRGQNPPANTQLYGAYGQPLPAGGRPDQYPPQQQPGQQGPPGQYPQPPQGYAVYPQPGMQPPGQQAQTGQKRPTDEPHTPTMPPPNPAEQQQFTFAVPNPAGASPASSTASSFHSAHAPTQPYYTAPPSAHPSSPSSAYSLDASRSSSSPHSMGGLPATPATLPTSYAVQPPMLNAVGGFAGTPPQSTAMNDMINSQFQEQQAQQWAAMQAAIKQEEHQRTSTDTTMVRSLNQSKDAGLAADGAVPATTEGAAEKQEEVHRREREMRDAGVQTDLAFPPQGKELDSSVS